MADSGLYAGLETKGYRIERVLGRGGMGEVWEATQLSLNRPVALKVIAGDITAQPGFERRFRTEALMAAKIEHHAVLPVYEHGTLDDGRLFLAMKLVEGSDLGSLLAERGALPLAEAVALLTPIAEALDAAHARKLLHRDVKPSNVLLESTKRGPRPYLADFGLAKPEAEDLEHTGTGHVVGTPDYMAPEQARGDSRIDGRVDVYSFGCLLYRAVTGERPYPRETRTMTMLAHINDPIPLPSRVVRGLPRAVDTVIQRTMQKAPKERAETVAPLMEWLAAEISPASPPSGQPAAPRTRGFRTRLSIQVAILAPAFVVAYLIGAKL